MRPVPSAGRRHQGHPADSPPAGSAGEQYACAEWRAILIFSSARSFPCTPRIRRPRAPGHKKIASATDIRGSKHYILYVPGPTCRGPVLLCMPPSAIKGETCDITHTHTRNLRSHLRLTNSYKLTSNTSHSGVGYYDPAANHSKLLRVLVFIPTSRNKQNA